MSPRRGDVREDVGGRDGGAVEFAISVLALDEDGPVQRETGKQTCRSEGLRHQGYRARCVPFEREYENIGAGLARDAAMFPPVPIGPAAADMPPESQLRTAMRLVVFTDLLR